MFTVLVVDDEDCVSTFLVAALKLMGFHTECARDCETALRLLKNNPAITLALVDIFIPNTPGPEIVRQLRNVQKNLLILYITGDDEIAVRENYGSLGKDQVLAKPFTLDMLKKKVLEIINLGAAA